MAEEKNPFIDIKYPDKVGPPMKDEHFLRGSTPMHKAAALLNMEEVDKLLADGSTDVDTGDVLDQTPLVLLARNHYDPEDVPKAVAMINKLIAAGATLTVEGKIRRDQYGDGVTHLAAMASGKNGHTVLEALVKALPAGDKAQLCSARCKNFGNTAVRALSPLYPTLFIRETHSPPSHLFAAALGDPRRLRRGVHGPHRRGRAPRPQEPAEGDDRGLRRQVRAGQAEGQVREPDGEVRVIRETSCSVW